MSGDREDGGDLGPKGELLELRFGDVSVSILRVADLAPFVDSDELLAIGEACEPPYWMHLWPGALALARWLAARGDLVDRRVLEVGCGLALPSLVASGLGAAVLATDREHAPLRFARRSAAANHCHLALACMDWHSAAIRPGACDLVIGADVAYDVAQQDALARTLAQAVRRGGKLVLADSVNTYRQGFLERLEQAGFNMRQSETAEREEGRTVWVRILEGERQ